MISLLDTHVHSIASGHAYSTITENIRAAADAGLQLVAITDHAPGMPDTALFSHFGNLNALPREMFGVTILRGVELNIMDYDGRTDMSDGQIRGLDVRIASLHTPCIKPGTAAQNTSAIIGAMRNPLIQVMGHIGDPLYPFDLDRVLDTAAETGTIIEINNLSLDTSHPARRGGEATVRAIAEGCLKRGLPVIMGSDAHVHTNVGMHTFAQALLEELGFPDELVLNTSISLFYNKMGLRTK